MSLLSFVIFGKVGTNSIGNLRKVEEYSNQVMFNDVVTVKDMSTVNPKQVFIISFLCEYFVILAN